ncbi:MAG TPA: response regulator transcription factor [Anaerolineales bacterium]|nr:response regulator transcription factor [Anaerolineales bacterium]
MDPIRVLIADDHALFRDGVCAILKGAPDIAAVGEAATGKEAILYANRLNPDVILMDIQMPDMNGIEATQRILELKPEIGIIMITMLEDDDFLFAAMRAGARGYVLKGANKAEMLKSIRAVADGEALFGPAIANRLSKFFRDLKALSSEKGESPVFPNLTDREREVLDLIAQGGNNQEIADRLHITMKTVSNHISNIFNKLQVADRSQAIVLARDAGLGKTKNQ